MSHLRKTLPDLVMDNTGKTTVTLEKMGGADGQPIWKCTNWECKLRKGYRPAAVNYAWQWVGREQVQGLVWCEHGGSWRR